MELNKQNLIEERYARIARGTFEFGDSTVLDKYSVRIVEFNITYFPNFLNII